MDLIQIIIITVGLGMVWVPITYAAYLDFKHLLDPDIVVDWRGLKQLRIIILIIIFWIVYVMAWFELVKVKRIL